jgi:multiple sugar transport system permease protein
MSEPVVPPSPAAQVIQPRAASHARRPPPLGRDFGPAMLFILPALIGFAVFFLYPAIRAVIVSFTSWNLLNPPQNVGFHNYQHALTSPHFWHALWVTVLYVLYNIPIQTVLALLVAILIHRTTKSVLIRALILVPYLLSSVVAGLLWLWMLNPVLGILNAIIAHLGFGHQAFFGSPQQALASVAAVNIWQFLGFNAILIFAGLQSIPAEIYEAAAIDGAGELTLFGRITLPLLRPVLVFVLVTSIVGSFQIFATITVTTQGGPANATNVIVWYIYQNAFQFLKMGYATATSLILFVLLLFFTILQFRLLRGGESDL